MAWGYTLGRGFSSGFRMDHDFATLAIMRLVTRIIYSQRAAYLKSKVTPSVLETFSRSASGIVGVVVSNLILWVVGKSEYQDIRLGL